MTTPANYSVKAQHLISKENQNKKYLIQMLNILKHSMVIPKENGPEWIL